MIFFRKDEISGESVSICPDRLNRPMDKKSEKNNSLCPFCPENASMTIPVDENSIKENGNVPKVRTVYNKYPIFEKTGELYGVHLVVIEGKEHNSSPFFVSLDERIEIFSEYIKMAANLYENQKIKYVQIFKNYKREGGASLAHPHSQILGIGEIPNDLNKEICKLKEYYNEHKSCFHCDTIRNEINKKERVIYNDGSYIAICPYVSSYPYEVRIYKINHGSSILKFGEIEIKNLAFALNKVLSMIYLKLGDIPFNMFLKFIRSDEKYYHFYLEICPRIGNYGGLEASTNIKVLTISPEMAAKTLTST